MSEILSQNSVDFRQTLRYAWDCGAIRSLNIPYRFAKRKVQLRKVKQKNKKVRNIKLGKKG